MIPIRTLAALLLLPTTALAQQVDPPTAWRQFQQNHGADWSAQWDPATGTPAAIYGPGLRVADRVDSLARARELARNLIDGHAALLGRGASEFVESSSARVRHLFYVVYQQRFGGLEVLGARADVRLNERGVVAMFGASAVQIPRDFGIVAQVPAAGAAAIAAGRVLGTIANGGNLAAPRLVIRATAAGEQGRAVPTLAWEVRIDARPADLTVGRAYVDARTGAFLHFENDVHNGVVRAAARPVAGAPAGTAPAVGAVSAARPAAPVALTGTVMAWTRVGLGPLGPLTNVPLANLLVTSPSGNAYTDANGRFSIPNAGTTPVTVSATLAGRHSKRVRVAQGTQMAAAASITPGTPGTIQFGTAAMGEFDRSQTATYYYVNAANEWLRGHLPGRTEMNLLSGIDPRVNIASSCNAFYSNFTINFYHRSSTCNMTAYNSVIIHELAHGLDHAFGGISRTDGLSEGWADVIAILHSQQPIVGTNFQLNGGFVRTALNTRTYPVASTSVHAQGEVWMGWTWDVRTFLAARLGTSAAQALTEKIVVPTIIANAGNMQAQIREVFLLDDDDGNLNNGTPNYKELEQASLKRTVPYPKRVNPNAGSYVTFGAGCKGSGKGVGTCTSNNPTGGTLSNTRAPNEYGYVATTASPIRVSGFSIFTRSTGTGNVTVRTAIYGNVGGRPATTPLATGTMTIGPTPAFYRTNLSASIPAGNFYVSVDHSAQTTYLANVTTGSTGVAFWRRPPMSTGAWAQSGLVSRSAFQVHCGTPGGGVPELSNAGVPELNSSFKVELAFAKENSPSLLLIGASNSAWGTLNLPFKLDVLGATGCTLLASGEARVGFTTSATGTFTQTFNVPNIPTLFGAQFYNQFVVSDSANGFGLVLSNAGAGKVGKQ